MKGFDNSCRNMLDIAAVPQIQQMSHLPVIVDPEPRHGPAGVDPVVCARRQ